MDRPSAEWDEWVERQPFARLGHAAAWADIFADAYGLKSHYLLARDSDGGISGVLPLVEARSLLGPRRLVSLPYLDAAGVLSASPDVREELVGGASELCKQGAGSAVELREATLGTTPRPPRLILRLRLESTVEAQWRALDSKVRNQTRKADREGLRASEATEPRLRRAFYAPFCANMRDLGSPVHAERFFEAAEQHFAGRLRFVVSFDGDRPVGGLVAIHFGDVVYVPWASTLRTERPRCANNQIYWNAIQWAIQRGARTFDFGRSAPGSGTYRFKRSWGATGEPLTWREFYANGRPPVEGSPDAGRVMIALSRLYSRLPLAVANAVGPRVRPHLLN